MIYIQNRKNILAHIVFKHNYLIHVCNNHTKFESNQIRTDKGNTAHISTLKKKKAVILKTGHSHQNWHAQVQLNGQHHAKVQKDLSLIENESDSTLQ